MRHAEKKYRPDKTNEPIHNDFRQIRQLKCELGTRTKALYYKKKLIERGNYSSKFFGQMNILLWRKKNSNILRSGKLPLPLASVFKNFFIDKIDEIMRGFHICHNSEDNFFYSRFPS